MTPRSSPKKIFTITAAGGSVNAQVCCWRTLALTLLAFIFLQSVWTESSCVDKYMANVQEVSQRLDESAYSSNQQSTVLLSPQKQKQQQQKQEQQTEEVCSGHGSMLFGFCFCQTGHLGKECENQDTTPIPACGPYDDRCFFHKDYGVAVVSEERWKSAQSFEDATWAEQRTSDRNDEHVLNFGGYADLLLLDIGGKMAHAGDTSVLGDMIEVGSGPFTQSLTIFEATGLRPKSITLVEPLAETYIKTVIACRYKTGVLTNGEDITIPETHILPIPAEQINANGKKYDTLVLLNMIEHVQDAFLIYGSAFEALKPGGIVIFHERFWPDYTGQEVKNRREFDLHPIRLNENFGHWMATEFDLVYEKEQPERWGNLGSYWIGRKRVHSATMVQNLERLGAAMDKHTDMLGSKGFTENNVWGNIYNARDMDQPREYFSYASLPWVKTICEIGFAGGHSTLVYLQANPNVKIYSFDDLGKRELSTTAYDSLKTQGNVTLTVGDSTKTVPEFIGTHPGVYCDVISVDGAHHEHFPDVDLHNFKYLANYPNIVLIDDYHKKDWPAVVKGVANRQAEGSLKLRHVSKSGVTFRDKDKQWAIGEYTMMTVIIASISEKRVSSLAQLTQTAASHPAVQQVIILWNTPDPMPEGVSKLARLPLTPGNKMARVTVIQSKTKSLNNRYDPSLPIHTGAVVILDDDLKVFPETFTCLLNAFKSDPSRVYSFGLTRKVTKTEYKGDTFSGSEENFVLPWMIFHRSLLDVYSDPAYKRLHQLVDTQKGHCDDITFAAIVTKHTGKPMVQIGGGKLNEHTREMNDGLTSSNERGLDRIECARDILTILEWELPAVEKMKCPSA